jgi:MFS family permease
MVEEKQSFGSLIHRKSFLLLSFLIFNSIAWLFLIMHIIDFTGPRSISQFSWIFYLAAIVSLLIGPLISEKTNKIRLLFIWVILGIISSISYAALPLFGEYGAKALLIFWGFSFGIGFPSCLSLIPSLTKIGERGRAGGITLFTTYAILPVLFILISDLDIFPASLALAGWRSLSLGALLLQVDIDKTSHLKPASYCSILRNSTFLLYLLPWLAFCLVNYLEIPVFEQFFGEFTTVLPLPGRDPDLLRPGAPPGKGGQGERAQEVHGGGQEGRRKGVT